MNAIDSSVELFIAPLRTEHLDVAMLMITTLFSTWTVIALLTILVILAYYCAECRYNALTICGAVLLSSATAESIKLLVQRERPIAIDIAYGIEQTYSFPSGHSAVAAAFFCAWGLLFWRNIKHPVIRPLIACGVAVSMICIALSRVYLRVHYTTDVLAGMCVGILCAYIAVAVKTYYNKR